MIRVADERAHNGRVERLRVLLTEGDLRVTPISGLAYEYYEEARLCWFNGAFVASIVMSQLAFEEMLRSHYRVARGVGGKLRETLRVDDAGFDDLIYQAKVDGWISSEEAASLDKIRKDYRNPFVHPHDVPKQNKSNKPNFLKQRLKMVAPELIGRGAGDEAQETIVLLVTLLPRISRRLYGLHYE